MQELTLLDLQLKLKQSRAENKTSEAAETWREIFVTEGSLLNYKLLKKEGLHPTQEEMSFLYKKDHSNNWYWLVWKKPQIFCLLVRIKRIELRV
jgi:hypothetical protein